MCTRTAFAAAAVALAAIVAAPVNAQPENDVEPPTPSRDERMERLERRLDELERTHQQELKSRDEEIERLKAQLGTGPASTQPAAVVDDHEEIEHTKRQIEQDLQDHDGHDHDHGEGADAAHTHTSLGFKPDLTVVADFVGSYSPDRENDAYNRLDVREVEVDFRAAVHPSADGVVILAFERDVENPIFPEPAGGEEEAGGPESSVNIEEAYLSLHDFGVPNLTAKVGRFHVRFGRLNLLHLHDLPTTDPPLVNQAFLSPESLGDAGVSLSYRIPPRYVGSQHVEVTAELLSGEFAASESPTLGGDLTVDSPAFNAHVLWNADLSRELNLELGASWLTGHADADNGNDVNLFGFDATIIRRDPGRRFRTSLLQGELMYAAVDADEGTNHALGAYVLGQQQLRQNWFVGTRLDWTEDPSDDRREAWGVTPYVSWYWTEHLRFRLSYQHRGGDRPEEDAVFFQLTWFFGAHPRHPYWEALH